MVESSRLLKRGGCCFTNHVLMETFGFKADKTNRDIILFQEQHVFYTGAFLLINSI